MLAKSANLFPYLNRETPAAEWQTWYLVRSFCGKRLFERAFEAHRQPGTWQLIHPVRGMVTLNQDSDVYLHLINQSIFKRCVIYNCDVGINICNASRVLSFKSLFSRYPLSRSLLQIHEDFDQLLVIRRALLQSQQKNRDFLFVQVTHQTLREKRRFSHCCRLSDYW